MSSAVRRSHFDPLNAAGAEKIHGNDKLAAVRDTTPRRAGRRNESASNFRHDLVRLSHARKCETAGSAICLPGRRRETELSCAWRGCKQHGVVVDRLRARVEICGRAGPSENSAARGWPAQSERAISGVICRRPIFETRLNVAAPRGAFDASSRGRAQDRDDRVRFRESTRQTSRPAIVLASRPAARRRRGADKRTGRPGRH